MWLEMTRHAAHGGEGWAFAECLWSPTHKDPSGRWSFWESLRRVRKDDIVVHLLGEGKRAAFVGYSTADADGYQTTSRPPTPGQYSYATSFYRVPLAGFVRFPDPISLAQVFTARDHEMRQYFAQNRLQPKKTREHVFFVVQAGRLQCLNGAYCSELSNELAGIVLGHQFGSALPHGPLVAVSARTGEQIGQIKTRLGQKDFSDHVRENYGHRCCFPGCDIAEHSLLVGAHIARWSDTTHLRGMTSNGLCLCLFHDRAFELGLFTLTETFRVSVNGTKNANSRWGTQNIAPFEGQQIRSGAIMPATDSLRQHWERIAFFPKSATDV